MAVEGWLTLDAAEKVFADAGLDFDQEKANAMQGPYSKAMNINASVTVNNTFKSQRATTLSRLCRAQSFLMSMLSTRHIGII